MDEIKLTKLAECAVSGCTKNMFDSQLIHFIHNIHEKCIHIPSP